MLSFHPIMIFSPIPYGPPHFMFEIVSDAGEQVIRPATPVAATRADNDVSGSYFATPNTTSSWAIQSAILRCEIIQVTNTVTFTMRRAAKNGLSCLSHLSQTFTASNTKINMSIDSPQLVYPKCFFTFSNSKINDNKKAGNFD